MEDEESPYDDDGLDGDGLEGDGMEDAHPGYGYPRPRYQPSPSAPRVPPWQEYLGVIQRGLESKPRIPASFSKEFQILYEIVLIASRNAGGLVVELLSRTRRKNGAWAAPKELRISFAHINSLPDPVDVEAISTMLGGYDPWTYQYSSGIGVSTRKTLPYALVLKLIPMIAAAGRLVVRDENGSELRPVSWDEGEPWKLWLEVRQDDRDQWKITGSLRRGAERMDLHEPQLLLECGLVLARGSLARLDHAGGFAWITQLKAVKHIPFPDRERELVLKALLDSPVLPPMELDEALKFEERRAPPRLGLRVAQSRPSWGAAYYVATLLFDYGRGWTKEPPDLRGFWLPEGRIYVPRDPEAEQAARETLKGLGLRQE